ncbi:MAG: AAA family ATPase [Cocleimonas sp.]|nr:AAA family ATPase [Cocleimonas sp.]
MKFLHLEFKRVKGVGSFKVDFTPDKSVHAFIGENGVGKTRFLETLFRALISTYQTSVNISKTEREERKIFNYDGIHTETRQVLKLSFFKKFLTKTKLNPNNLVSMEGIYEKEKENYLEVVSKKEIKLHQSPIVFIAAQNRGFIKNTLEKNFSLLGNFKQRRDNYIRSLFLEMDDGFSSLNMDIDIEQWFISIAQSSNPFQKKQDNREIEIRIVLKLCHQIDNNIDPEFMEISGDNRVFIKVNDQKTQLSHLSTGYASILKIIQSIISGYGYFTNEQQLQNVKGIVLIDEIDSHLHLSWQSKIIPMLKELFPNTTFYITTHSPVVLTQLEDGEVYRLQREKDGRVHSNKINHPSNAIFADILDDAFDIDLNAIKLQKAGSEQKQAKQALLDFIKKQRKGIQ